MFKPTRKILHVVSVFFLAGSVFLTACKDDEDESIRPSVEIPDQFSDNTPEENKAALEDNGIELVNNLESFKSTAGVKSLISLNSCLSSASLPEGGRVGTENPAGKMFRIVSSFGRGTASAKDVLSAMRIREDEPLSPQEEFDAAAGIYAYSRANNTWTKTAASDKIVFQFPSTETGMENNAEVSIYDFATVPVSNPEAEYEDDLPTGIKADLKVDGTAIVEYRFAASYKSNGEPTSVNTSLTITPFKFSFIAKNTTSEVAADYAFTMNNENLISFGMGASGEFTSENALGEGSGPESVVNDASAYFQLMNIKFAGKVDIQKWSELVDESGSMQNMADAWNGSTELVIYYADTKEKIADGEFYVSERQDYCYDYNGDGIEDPETECEYSEIVDLRMIFADESKADLATYTDEGFDELSTTFEEFMTELEEDLG